MTTIGFFTVPLVPTLVTEKIAGITTEAVKNATGHPWSYWIDLLDEQDGTSLTHKERVAALATADIERGW